MKANDIESVNILDYEKYFTLHWKMTSWCNYSCSYCIQHHKENNGQKQYDYERFIAYARKLDEMSKLIDADIRLHLLGGEISYMNIKKILDEFSNPRLKKISIVTNLSNDISWYKNLHEYCKKRGLLLSVCASLHDEYVDTKEFIDKVDKIKDFTHVQFTVTDKNEENFKTLKRLCGERHIMYKTEGDKNRKKPLQKYDQCSDNFPVLARVRYKEGKEEIMPVPVYRSRIVENENGFLCESSRCALVDFDGGVYDGTCTKKRKFGNLLEVNVFLLRNIMVKRKKACKREYCHLCYPVKIYPQDKKLN